MRGGFLVAFSVLNSMVIETGWALYTMGKCDENYRHVIR